MNMKQLALPLALQRMSHLTSTPSLTKVMTFRPARPGMMTVERSSPCEGKGVSAFRRVVLCVTTKSSVT